MRPGQEAGGLFGGALHGGRRLLDTVVGAPVGDGYGGYGGDEVDQQMPPSQ